MTPKLTSELFEALRQQQGPLEVQDEQGEAFDGILLDLNMPRKNGTAVLAERAATRNALLRSTC